jgi:uncharacterized protein
MMRRRDKQITRRRDMDAVIRGSLVCRLALAKDNQPYLVPVAFGYDGRALYLHTALEGTKLEYFRVNPRVCFEFERHVELRRHPKIACRWSLAYESVIGYGTLRELVSSAAKRAALNQIMRQYSGKTWTFGPAAVVNTRVWKITITSLTGKRSQPKQISD